MNAAKKPWDDVLIAIRAYAWIIFPGCFMLLALKSL
jgi:hypothetical protein